MKYFRILYLAVFFLIPVPSAFACVCAGTSSVTEEFKDAAAVFSGKYVGSEYRKGIVNQFREMQQSEGQRIEYEVLVLKFEVEEWWKGNLDKEVILVTEQTRASDGTVSVSDCELGFEKGKRYLVYAFGEGNELGASACSRTKSLRKAKADLKELGKGNKPR
jgi:hypothetical protein